jgi:hypothetical protein
MCLIVLSVDACLVKNRIYYLSLAAALILDQIFAILLGRCEVSRAGAGYRAPGVRGVEAYLL